MFVKMFLAFFFILTNRGWQKVDLGNIHYIICYERKQIWMAQNIRNCSYGRLPIHDTGNMDWWDHVCMNHLRNTHETHSEEIHALCIVYKSLCPLVPCLISNAYKMLTVEIITGDGSSSMWEKLDKKSGWTQFGKRGASEDCCWAGMDG